MSEAVGKRGVFVGRAPVDCHDFHMKQGMPVPATASRAALDPQNVIAPVGMGLLALVIARKRGPSPLAKNWMPRFRDAFAGMSGAGINVGGNCASSASGGMSADFRSSDRCRAYAHKRQKSGCRHTAASGY